MEFLLWAFNRSCRFRYDLYELLRKDCSNETSLDTTDYIERSISLLLSMLDCAKVGIHPDSFCLRLFLTNMELSRLLSAILLVFVSASTVTEDSYKLFYPFNLSTENCSSNCSSFSSYQTDFLLANSLFEFSWLFNKRCLGLFTLATDKLSSSLESAYYLHFFLRKN